MVIYLVDQSSKVWKLTAIIDLADTELAQVLQKGISILFRYEQD